MPHDIPAPMLAASVPDLPAPDSVPGGLSYEPKWDGFRGLISWDGDTVEIGSRGAKPLTRYFPELVEAISAQLPEPCLLDGEIAVPTGAPGAQRLDWEALSQRIHPAASRVARLSAETPAIFIAYDLLADGEGDLQGEPFEVRRARLERLVGGLGHPLHLTRTTRDADLAQRWLAEFEGAGLDGVVAKRLAGAYTPNKRTMFKVKHARTADVVALGYRVHKSGTGLGSLLLGLYDADGQLRNVGAVSAFSNARRVELIDELDPLVARDADGQALSDETERSRFSAGKDTRFVRLRPERVLEVRYDQLEGARFRHTVQFERWRPDRDPASCRFDQLEVVSAFDVGRVLA
ncbi:ATP-dependent DNA ligase [Microbacterium kribbense]|uniref:DNA ligase (ATP) n=1 Tax=Microbacterium kribbense TaxID=433645 RepID=A0ABP7GF78_9MICO